MSQATLITKRKAFSVSCRSGGAGASGPAISNYKVGGHTTGVAQKLEQIRTPKEINEAIAELRRRQAEVQIPDDDLRHIRFHN